MNIGIYQSAASLSALEQWQDAVAQNITSGQVTGYRKRTVEFSAQASGGWQLNPGATGGSGDSTEPALFPKATAGISYAAGETQPTGRDLDLAIQGDGFFEVQLPDGTRGYTRSGEFSLRADETLVNSANDVVLGQSGSPVVLSPAGGKITVNPDGSIVQGTTTVGQLAVVNFTSNGALTPSADGVFLASPGVTPQPVAKPQVQQGYLESSNSAPLGEMVNMVQISRAYEANQHVITSADQRMQKELNALG